MRSWVLAGLFMVIGALSFVPSAGAVSVPIGEVASPTGFGAGCGACSDVQFTTDPASPSYTVPALPPTGGPWTLTSWSFRGGPGMGTSSARVLVWRLTGVPNEVRLIASGSDQVVASGQVGTFPVSIPVEPGDLLGVRSGSNMDPTYDTASPSDLFIGATGSPAIGQTTGAVTSDFGHVQEDHIRLNVAATLTAPDPPAKKKKCKKKKKKRSAESAKKKKCKKRRKK